MPNPLLPSQRLNAITPPHAHGRFDPPTSPPSNPPNEGSGGSHPRTNHDIGPSYHPMDWIWILASGALLLVVGCIGLPCSILYQACVFVRRRLEKTPPEA